MGAQSPRYRDLFNTIVSDAQFCGEDLGRYSISAGENDQALHVGEADSDQKRGSSTPPPQDDGDIAEVFLPAAVS